MATPIPDKPEDFSASDILSAEAWTGRAQRPVVGIDVVCTKIAVDFQNLKRESVDDCLRRNLELLRDTTGSDCSFLASLNPDDLTFADVQLSRSAFAQCRPEGLSGSSLESLPWLKGRTEHLRLSELRDTSLPRKEQAVEAARLAELHIGSALLVVLRVAGKPAGFLGLAQTMPRGAWDVNTQLLMKLIGTSLATGLERIRTEARLAKLEERTKLYQAAANDGLWDYDVESNEMYVSPRWKAMLGYADEDMPGSPDWRALVHPDDLSRVQAALRDHVAGKTQIFESTHRMRHRNGEWRWVNSRATARVDKQGRLLRLVGVELDITERKLYEEALFREKQSAQITLQSIGDGVITTDANSTVEYINPVAEELTGWRLEDAMGRPVEEIFRAFHEETCEPLENPLSVSIRRIRPIPSVRPVLLIKRDGNELYVESTAAPIRDAAGHVAGGVLVFRDVSESRELNRRLSYHERHDLLTGLVNRREFEARLERALMSAKAREASYALCYLDIDQFKIVNDACGHSGGDAVLGQVGALLKSKVGWRDTLSRLGGDEFGVLLANCSLEEAMRTAETMREAVVNFRFNWEDRRLPLHASIGVVPISADNNDVAGVLSAADNACAAAKESGGNRVHSFAENDIQRMARRREMEWAARIHAALGDGRFELYRMAIQPLQRTEIGEHYELLLRLKDENGGIVAAQEFIDAAERYGMAPAIDRWVIENAFRWLVSEADEREKLFQCSINLSAKSLGDEKFLPFVHEQFERSGLDAGKICFEITESDAIKNFAHATRFVQSLKKRGCKFALDDFGKGHSGFGYLKHFPVDFLKIDGSFVREILHDPVDREMVKSINEIAHHTQKRTIAEFAENAEIIQELTRLGVDYAQGYGVSQPQRVVRSAVA
jgi:diguanylate cyclase (GGDEF)-like protein/PAS domain S-box-containing protein